jgi:hypothetical protein
VALQISRVGQSPGWDDAELRLGDVDAYHERAAAFGGKIS